MKAYDDYIKYHRQFLSFPDQIELDSSVKELKSLKEHIKHLQERMKYEEKVIKRLVQKTAGKTHRKVIK